MEQSEKDARACYTADDPLDCVRKVVSHYKKNGSACKPRFVLLTQNDCEPCEKAKKEFADDIANGIVESIPFDSPEGAKIVKNNKIQDVPSLILLDCHDNIISPV